MTLIPLDLEWMTLLAVALGAAAGALMGTVLVAVYLAGRHAPLRSRHRDGAR